MSHQQDVDHLAKIVWDYLHVHHTLKPADAILALGSSDTRVAAYAAQLYLRGLAPHLIFSGDAGRVTFGKYTKPEAERFAAIAVGLGVPKRAVLLETASTNTGQNIAFSYELMQAHHLPHRSVIVVHKPYMERRTYATFRKQWPDQSTDVMVTSPPISYEQYFSTDHPKDFVINVMVGDLQRIREYPKLGFQIEQDIPAGVWSAYEQLVALGYDRHLIKN